MEDTQLVQFYAAYLSALIPRIWFEKTFGWLLLPAIMLHYSTLGCVHRRGGLSTQLCNRFTFTVAWLFWGVNCQWEWNVRDMGHLDPCGNVVPVPESIDWQAEDVVFWIKNPECPTLPADIPEALKTPSYPSHRFMTKQYPYMQFLTADDPKVAFLTPDKQIWEGQLSVNPFERSILLKWCMESIDQAEGSHRKDLIALESKLNHVCLWTIPERQLSVNSKQ